MRLSDHPQRVWAERLLSRVRSTVADHVRARRRTPAIRKYRINHACGLFRPGREKSRLSRGLTKAPLVPDMTRYRANYHRGPPRVKIKKIKKQPGNIFRQPMCPRFAAFVREQKRT